MPTLRPSLVAVALAGAAAVAGCSGAEPPTGPDGAASSAPPARQPTVKVAKVALPGQPGPLVDTISRQVKAARYVHATVTSTAPDGSRTDAVGDLRTDTATPTAKVRISDRGVTHAVLLGGVIYARDEGEQMDPGKPWMRVSRKEIAAARAAPGQPPELLRLIDAMEALRAGAEKAMREIATDTGLQIVRDGTFTKPATPETVAGVAARRYEGTTATSALPGKEWDAVKGEGVDGLPWTLWVDARGLPVRFTLTMDAGKNGDITTTASYSRWGVPVTVEAPPASQVATLAG